MTGIPVPDLIGIDAMPPAHLSRFEQIVNGGAARPLSRGGCGAPSLAVSAPLGMRLEAEQAHDLGGIHLKLSLRRRISPNTWASLLPFMPRRDRMELLSGLRNGLVASSSPIVVGSVISFRLRAAKTRSARS